MSNTPASIAIDEEGAHDGCPVEPCPIIGACKVRVVEVIEPIPSGRLNAFPGTAA
jgi:hypothetical protein